MLYFSFKRQGLIAMDDLILLTFRMLMKFTYGSDISEDDLNELIELRALVGTLIADTFTNPYVKLPLYKYMPTKTNRILAEFERRWLQFNKRYEVGRSSWWIEYKWIEPGRLHTHYTPRLRGHLHDDVIVLPRPDSGNKITRSCELPIVDAPLHWKENRSWFYSIAWSMELQAPTTLAVGAGWSRGICCPKKSLDNAHFSSNLSPNKGPSKH